MFVKIEDFVESWRHESKATQRVMDALTDESLKQAVAQDYRTLGRLAWHVAVTIHEMMSRTGLQFESLGDEHTPAPDCAADIADGYKRSSAALLEAVRSQWTDESLKKSVNLYGEDWANGFTLRVLIQHEVHHRGQMTVLMRQAGLRVPDIYGPTREGWIEMGMQPQQ